MRVWSSVISAYPDSSCRASVTFGLLYEQFVEQFRNLPIDMLRTVATVETENHQGEVVQQRFEYRVKEHLTDRLAAGHAFVPGHTFHGIDVVEISGHRPDRLDARCPRADSRNPGAELVPVLHEKLDEPLETAVANYLKLSFLAANPDSVPCKTSVWTSSTSARA